MIVSLFVLAFSSSRFVNSHFVLTYKISENKERGKKSQKSVLNSFLLKAKKKTQTMNFLRKGQGSVTKLDNSELKPSIIEPEMLARAHV